MQPVPAAPVHPESGSVGGHFGIVCDQRYQGILLPMGQLAKPLEQLAFVQRKLWAVQTHAQLIAQCAFLDKTLFQARDDLGIHAAMMITSYFRNAFAHPVRKTYDEFVSRSTGVNSLFHWAHNLDRLVQG